MHPGPNPVLTTSDGPQVSPIILDFKLLFCSGNFFFFKYSKSVVGFTKEGLQGLPFSVQTDGCIFH